MLSAYIVCMIAGGVVLGASAFGGHESGDAGAGDAGGGDAGGGDAHAGDSHGHQGHHELAAKLPFLSLRFWTWGVTFFGVTGAVLTWGGTSAALAPVLAVVLGVGSGWGATYVLGRLSREAVGEIAEASGHVGREGRLLLPLRKGERSKVRLSIGGCTTDLLAETDSDVEIPAGSPVLVVGMRGLLALVESTPTALGAAESDDSSKEES